MKAPTADELDAWVAAVRDKPYENEGLEAAKKLSAWMGSLFPMKSGSRADEAALHTARTYAAMLRAVESALRDDEACDECWRSAGKYASNHGVVDVECTCVCHEDDNWPTLAGKALALHQQEE